MLHSRIFIYPKICTCHYYQSNCHYKWNQNIKLCPLLNRSHWNLSHLLWRQEKGWPRRKTSCDILIPRPNPTFKRTSCLLDRENDLPLAKTNLKNYRIQNRGNPTQRSSLLLIYPFLRRPVNIFTAILIASIASFKIRRAILRGSGQVGTLMLHILTMCK